TRRALPSDTGEASQDGQVVDHERALRVEGVACLDLLGCCVHPILRNPLLTVLGLRTVTYREVLHRITRQNTRRMTREDTRTRRSMRLRSAPSRPTSDEPSAPELPLGPSSSGHRSRSRMEAAMA